MTATDELRRALWWKEAALGFLYVVLAGFMVYVFAHNSSVTKRQNSALNLLCDRTYNLAPIVDDVVVNLIERIGIRLAADLKAGDEAAAERDRVSLIKFQEAHVRLQDQLLQQESPCRKVP